MLRRGPTSARRPASSRRRAVGTAAASVAGLVVALVSWLALRGGGDDPVGPTVLAIPAYGHPTLTALWHSLAELPAGSVVVLNPASGPGVEIEAPYARVVQPVRAAGVRIYGYVDTDYGRRGVEEIEEEALRFVDWYGVTGIFLDQTTPRGPALETLERIVDRLRTDGLEVAVNPGQPDLDPRYADLDALVVDFEGSLVEYRAARFPSSIAGAARARSWHLVYDVRSAGELDEALALAGERGARAVFVTDGTMPNPWDRLPPYFAAERQAVARRAAGA